MIKPSQLKLCNFAGNYYKKAKVFDGSRIEYKIDD
jgi:hypothetical protein